MIITAAEIIATVKFLLTTAKNLWETGRKILGKDAIPEWDTILGDIQKSQAAVEEEKKKYETPPE